MLPALNLRGSKPARRLAGSEPNPTEARASIDFRLVPDETPDSIKLLVERHIAEQGYTIVHDTPDAAMRQAKEKIIEMIGKPVIPPPAPRWIALSHELAEIMTAAGHEPVLLPTSGGSLPIHLFQSASNAPSSLSRSRTTTTISTLRTKIFVSRISGTGSKFSPRFLAD